MTREMYETLAMTDLRAIARQRGLKLAAHVKKAEIIDQMIDLDNREAAAAAAAAEEAKAARREAATRTVSFPGKTMSSTLPRMPASTSTGKRLRSSVAGKT